MKTSARTKAWSLGALALVTCLCACDGALGLSDLKNGPDPDSGASDASSAADGAAADAGHVVDGSATDAGRAVDGSVADAGQPDANTMVDSGCVICKLGTTTIGNCCVGP
jgi:hypothetical protein